MGVKAALAVISDNSEQHLRFGASDVCRHSLRYTEEAHAALDYLLAQTEVFADEEAIQLVSLPMNLNVTTGCSESGFAADESIISSRIALTRLCV